MVSNQSRQSGNIDFTGNIRFTGSVYLGSEQLTDQNVSPNSAIDSEKLEHKNVYPWFVNGTIADDSITLGTIDENFSDIVEVNVVITGSIPTSSAAVAIDIQKAADGAGSWTSVLSAPITLNSSSVLRTAVAGAIDAANAHNLTGVVHLRATFTTSGSGSHAVDVAITVKTKERAVA